MTLEGSDGKAEEGYRHRLGKCPKCGEPRKDGSWLRNHLPCDGEND